MQTAERQAWIEALRWHVDQGVTDALGDEPQDATVWINAAPPPPVRQAANITPPQAAPETPRNMEQHAPPTFLGVAEARAEAVRAAAAAKTLDELKAAIAAFQGFAISKTATNLVFADGDPDASIMLVGEAPGADEDRLGKPFVGASGQLLDKILRSIGLDRNAQEQPSRIYISNMLNWRPPGNRNPTPAEIEMALPFIERHIQLAAPKILIFCGSVSAKALLDTEQGISRLRGRWHNYMPRTKELTDKANGPIPALATYHPSYLLRTPGQKKLVWADMLEIHSKINDI